MKKIFLFASAVAMLASCSKDLTEDVVAPVPGKSKIVASFEVEGTSSRTHLENGKSYKWDSADALGVFVNSVNGDDTNATFKCVDEAAGVFSGDFDMLGGNEYAVYYPWAYGTALTADGKVNLVIPAKQNFNHQISAKVAEGGDYAGSFAQNTAPGVGTGVAEGEDEVTLKVAFKGVATYLVVPVQGFGTIKSATLEISDTPLHGAGEVNLRDEKPALKLTAESVENENNKITLNCGKGVALDVDAATNLWFVVPALNNTKGKELTITVTDTEGNEQVFTRDGFNADLAPNTAYLVRNNNQPWVFDPENHYLIENADQFLEYAYAATNGYTAVSALEGFEESYAYDMFVDNELRPAILIKDIDMSEVTTSSGLYDDVVKMNDYQKEVYYDGYQTKGLATIGGKQAFTIDGKFNDKIATIKNLKVKGKSLFYDGYNGAKLKETVANVKFENVTVDAKGQKEAAFLTSRFFPGNQSIVFSNITVGTGCEVLADEDVKTALVNRAFTSAIVDIENETELVYANTLNVFDHEVWFTGEKAIDVDYNAITVHENFAGAILHVADKEAAVAMIEAIEGTTWFSVVDADTSYWTGFYANKVTDDDYFTAEELAYVVKTRTDSETSKGYVVTMTNNIDLMEKSWPIVTTDNTAITIDGADEYAISNINIDGTTVEEQTATSGLYYTTFGRTASAKNLTLKNVVISVKEGDKTPHIAAVANTPGSATANVTVDGLKITTTVACADGIGGLFGTLTKTNATAGTCNYLKGCEIKNVDVTGVAEGLAYGDLAGKLTITVGGVAALTVENLAAYENNPFGSIAATVSTTQVEETTAYEPAYKSTALDFSKFAAPVKEGDIVWATQKNTADKVYKLAGFVLFVTNNGDKNSEWRMVHPGNEE